MRAKDHARVWRATAAALNKMAVAAFNRDEGCVLMAIKQMAEWNAKGYEILAKEQEEQDG